MAAIQEWDVGTTVRLTVQFKNLDGALADPDSVTAKVQDPSGSESTPDATKASTGVYYIDIDTDEAGDWYARMTGTGAVKAAFEGKFVAKATQF